MRREVPRPVISEARQRHIITKPFSAESIHIFSQLMFARDFLGIHWVAQPKMIKMAMALQQLHHDILESGYLKYPSCKFQICPKLPKFVQLQKPRETDQPVTQWPVVKKSPTSPKRSDNLDLGEEIFTGWIVGFRMPRQGHLWCR